MSTITEPQPSATEPASGAFRVERDGDLAVVWFDLPGEKVNKLSSAVMQELEGLIEHLAGMHDVRKVLIVSGKENIFIAGADISEFERVPGAKEAEEYTRWGQRVFQRLSGLPQVTFALIHGACMGGGTELALNCDYRLVSDGPKTAIALPEVKLGIIPAWTGTTRLPRLVGLPAALDMILTGKTIRPKKAKAIGLADAVVPAAIRLEAAKRFVATRNEKRGKSGRTHLYLEGNRLARALVFRKARKTVLKKTSGHYPAPLEAIRVMETGFRDGLEAGFAAEARAAAKLITGDVAQNLVRLFFLMEEAKKTGGLPPPVEVRSVGVLGAGLMGGGIAQAVVDKADIPVRVRDIQWDALAGGMKAAAKIWKRQVDRKRISRAEMDRKLAQITSTLDWTGFSKVDVVIEAVIEKLEIKQQVLAELESIARTDAVFATNTSTIPIHRIAANAQRPEQVIGMHFFSPVDRMPLVEIIAGERTSQQTVSTIAALGRRMGKTVVICKDGPGFIVNRILGPYINEAGMLVEEGKTIESIDRAMTQFGMPLGPLALLDEVGIDVAGKAAEVLREAFGERMQTSSLIEKLLDDRRFGKKNGRGVYEWTKGKRDQPDASVYSLVSVRDPESGDEQDMVDRMVLLMINEASRILEEGVAFSAADVDLSMIMGTGFPPFRGGLLRYAEAIGLSWVVARLEELESRLGSRFAPSEPLRRLAEQARSFYDAYPRRIHA